MLIFFMLHTIKSSLNANMRGISVIANNIANSNTTAFKKSNSNFSDIYSTTVSSSPNSFTGMGVMNDDPRKQMFQGPLKQVFLTWDGWGIRHKKLRQKVCPDGLKKPLFFHLSLLQGSQF